MTATPLSDPVLEAAAQILLAGEFFSSDGHLIQTIIDARLEVSNFPRAARQLVQEAARQLEALRAAEKGKDDE